MFRVNNCKGRNGLSGIAFFCKPCNHFMARLFYKVLENLSENGGDGVVPKKSSVPAYNLKLSN